MMKMYFCLYAGDSVVSAASDAGSLSDTLFPILEHAAVERWPLTMVNRALIHALLSFLGFFALGSLPRRLHNYPNVT